MNSSSFSFLFILTLVLFQGLLSGVAQTTNLHYHDMWGPGVKAPHLTELGDSIAGKREGFWYLFYNGTFLGAGSYKKGLRDSVWTYYYPVYPPKEPSGVIPTKRELRKMLVSTRIGYRNNQINGYVRTYFPESDQCKSEFRILHDSLIGKGYEFNPSGLVVQQWHYDSLQNGYPFITFYVRKETKGSAEYQVAFMKKNYVAYGCYDDSVSGFPVWDKRLKKIIPSRRWSGEAFKDFTENDPPFNAEGTHRTFKDGILWENYGVEKGKLKYKIRNGVTVKK
jgi:hypothetical protein